MAASIMLKWPQSRKKIRNVIFEIETAEEIHDPLYWPNSSFAITIRCLKRKKKVLKCFGSDNQLFYVRFDYLKMRRCMSCYLIKFNIQ